jgi:hypothetical protein
MLLSARILFPKSRSPELQPPCDLSSHKRKPAPWLDARVPSFEENSTRCSFVFAFRRKDCADGSSPSSSSSCLQCYGQSRGLSWMIAFFFFLVLFLFCFFTATCSALCWSRLLVLQPCKPSFRVDRHKVQLMSIASQVKSLRGPMPSSPTNPIRL